MRGKSWALPQVQELHTNDNNKTDFCNPAFEPSPTEGDNETPDATPGVRQSVWSGVCSVRRLLQGVAFVLGAAALASAAAITTHTLLSQSSRPWNNATNAPSPDSQVTAGTTTASTSLPGPTPVPPHPALCGGELRGLFGSFHTPGYAEGARYPRTVRCEWHVQVPAHLHVALRFSGRFAVEGAPPCLHDALTLTDAATQTPITRLCGGRAPPTLHTHTHSLLAVFTSDSSVEEAGFNVTYHAHHPDTLECAQDEWACDVGRCLLPQFVCDGVTDCVDRSDEENCNGTFQLGCGGVLTDSEGTITSPLYPEPYPPLQVCVWRIVVPEGLVVELHVEEFHLEPHPLCLYDHLDVLDSPPARTLIGRFCGSHVPPHLISSGNELLVSFVSDEATTAPGFRATYIAVNQSERGCAEDEFKCFAPVACIPMEWVCDGWFDCVDGSDERNCTGLDITQTNNSDVECEGVRVEMCSGLSYNLTSFPNVLLSLPDQDTADALLQHYKVLTELACYPHLRFLVCAVLVPGCVPGEGVRPPCREVCAEALDACADAMRTLSLPWPISCELYPEAAQGGCTLP
ncbi:membrane frizzled-related protein [Lampetra fluviatilis]